MSPNRKGLLMDRLLAATREYEATFKTPVPMKVLSGRFGKALAECGGFPEVIAELQADGSLHVILSPSGARHVTLTAPAAHGKTG